MKPGGSRIWRWSKRIVIGALLLAILLVGITLIAIHTDWGRDKIRVRVEALLKDTFPGGATIEKLEGSPFGRLTISGIAINSIDGKPAITVDKVVVEAAIRPLLKKRVEISTLDVEGVHVVLGGERLTKASDKKKEDEDKKSEPPVWSIDVAAFEVRDATVEVVGKQPMTFTGATINGSAKVPAGGAIEAVVQLATTWKERALPVSADARFVIDDAATIPTATVSIGNAKIVATHVLIDTVHPVGRLEITGSQAALAAIDPRIDVPADLALTITASTVAGSPNRTKKSDGKNSTAVRDAASEVLATQVDIDGKLGDSTVRGAMRGNVAHQWADVFLAVGASDVGMLTRGAVVGRGEVALVVHADRKGLNGVAGVRGLVASPAGDGASELPASDATIFFDSTWQQAKVIAFAENGDARMAVTATASIAGDRKITIEQAKVVATGRDFTRASGGRIALTSHSDLRVEATLDEPATLAPVLHLVASGTIHGSNIAYGFGVSPTADSVRVGELDVRWNGEVTGKVFTGYAVADVRAVAYAGKPQGSAVVTARYGKDGKIRTTVKARPAAAPVTIEVAGDVTIGDAGKVDIALGDHRVTPAPSADGKVVSPPWTGRGGHIAISDTVSVTGFSTTNGAGTAKIDATLVRATGVIDATVDANQFALATFDSKVKGTVSGKLTAKRRGTRWDATGDLSADNVVLGVDQPMFTGKAHVEAHGRTVTLDVRASSPELGGVRVELDVEGPADITDAAGWRGLERRALRTAKLTVENVELTNISPDTGGSVDGNLQIGALPDATTGTLIVKSVRTPLGIAEGRVAFSPLADDLYASWAANLSDVGEAKINVQIRFPQHPFDPVEWQQLGRGVVRSVVASLDDIAVDPAKLAKLGIVTTYKGRADIKLAVGAAATAAKLDLDFRKIEGGALRRPIDVHVEARTDATETKACAWVSRAGAERTPVPPNAPDELCLDAPAKRLFALEGIKTPVPFATWVNAPKAALAAKLEGKLAVPSQSARGLMLMVGRDVIDPKKGTIGGEIAFTGTIGKPGAKGAITANNIKLVSGISVRENPELTKLQIAIDLADRGGKVEVTAIESHGGELSAKLYGSIDQPNAAIVTFLAKKLDLGPLAAFLPGELAASQGTMRGAVVINGLDLTTSKIKGDLSVDGLYMPIAPIVGTLHGGRIMAIMNDTGLEVTGRGLLNSCKTPGCTQNVRFDAKAPPDLSTLTANLNVTKITTLGEIEPVIDADAHAELRRNGRKWTGSIDITNGFVYVPPSVADDLLEAEDPEDVYFVEKPPPKNFFERAHEPEKVWLEARINLASTRIEVEEYGVRGSIRSKNLVMKVGDTIGLVGKIVVEKGDADDIFGRQYTLERNEIVNFDGTIDPEIDLQLTHQFPGLLLRVTVQGRPSHDDFPHPRFSDPDGRYTEGELFAFFLGGDPSGDRSAQTKEAGLGVGASVLSQAVAKRVKKYLPKRLTLDVIKCEPGTTAAGASCTFGKRFLDDDLYIAYKRRLQPLPNENADEAQLQYYLSREWFLEGVGGSANIIGADLLWRKRW